MAITYKWCDVPVATPRAEQKRIYPKLVTSGSLTTTQLCKKMANHTGFSEGEIRGVLSDFLSLCREELGNGKSIHLEGLGEFSATLTTTEPVYPTTLHKEHKVCLKSISYRPDKVMKLSLNDLHTHQSKTSVCSNRLSNVEIDMRLKDYFSEHSTLDRDAFQLLCGFLRTTAIRHLHRLCEEGKLRNLGSQQHPLYEAVPGYYGVSRNRTEKT